jgi:putative heme-binding domain-containing protein
MFANEFAAQPAFWNKPLIKAAVTERLARRFAQSGSRQDLLHCAFLFDTSPGPDHTKLLERGFEEGIKGRPLAALPRELLTAMRKAGVQNETLSIRLGDQEAIASALTAVADSKTKKDRRLRLMEALGEIDSEKVAASLSGIATRLEDPVITRSALMSLQRQTKGVDADFIANALLKFDADSQLVALNLLASRAATAGLIPQEVRREKFDAKNVPPDIISKLRLHVPEPTERIWGPEKRQTTGEMQVEIDRITALLNTGIGTPYEGIKVYTMACGACHKLFSQGGQIGPDLTTYKRDDLANMLLNIVHPNAEIREGYVNYMLNTKDGRTLTGFLADEDKQVVTMRGIDGANNTIPRAEIEEMKPTGYSLMPEGLLQGLNDQQLRDLFAYLRSAQPLVR